MTERENTIKQNTGQPQSLIEIHYDPDTQENIVRRAKLLKGIVRKLEGSRRVPQEVLFRRFEI